MRTMIENSSQRAVVPLDLVVKMEQIGGTGDTYDITVRIGNEVPANTGPAAVSVDAGPTFGFTDEEYSFETTTSDPDSDELYYQWNWGDGKGLSEWIGPFASGETCITTNSWVDGDYDVQVRAKDDFGAETEWSASSSIHIQCCIVRGNVNYDSGGDIDISDLVYLVDYMFIGGEAPICTESANINGDEVSGIDISDLVFLVDYMFVGGTPPPSCVP